MTEQRRKLLVGSLLGVWFVSGLIHFPLYLAAGEAQGFPRPVEPTLLMNVVFAIGMLSFVAAIYLNYRWKLWFTRK